jgi:uncharacterized membrane protein YeiH
MEAFLTDLVNQVFAVAGDIGAALGSATAASNPTDASVWVPSAIEFLAVIAGALAGALTACERGLDIVGVCTLALITSLGGGLVRDMILSNGSVYMLDHPAAVLCCLAAGLVAFYFPGLLYKLNKPVTVFDLMSMALFTFTGADKALMAGYGFVACVLMGVVTGVGGGLMRDVCLQRIPGIFLGSNLYAVCSIAGAVAYMLLVDTHVSKTVAALVCLAVVFVLRWASLRFDLVTGSSVDLTPHLMRPIRKLRQLKGPHKPGKASGARGAQPSSAGSTARAAVWARSTETSAEPSTTASAAASTEASSAESGDTSQASPVASGATCSPDSSNTATSADASRLPK